MADVSREEARRWYCVTPERCVVALLALEGLLWLSGRFRWLPFNQHKGWTVLVCLATVAAAFVLMFLWFLAALVFRWRFQFSIRSLFVLTVVVAVPSAWLAAEMKAARKQREAVEAIERAGGGVSYDYQSDASSGKWTPYAKPLGLPWLRSLLGGDLFVRVTLVNLPQSEVSDADLKQLEALTDLQELCLSDAKISDAGLQHLRGLTQLQVLDLEGTKVGDAGLEYLEGLTRLRARPGKHQS